jgi:flagellar assembly protein FliH
MKENYHGDIEEYTFQSFSATATESDEVSEYSFSEFDGKSIREIEEHQAAIKLERNHAKESSFKIAPIVLEHRGIKDQIDEEREDRIRDEVEKRVEAIRDEAYRIGHEEGVHAGREEVFEQTRLATEEKLTTLTSMINEVLKTKVELVDRQKKQIYGMVRNLTKWVILRELKDDGVYIQNLLEKLILELQAKSNLLIHVDQKSFELMPDVLEVVQKRFGELVNVRVEIDYDIEGPGIVLESDNGIINGSLIEQFKSLDKLFKSVGLQEEAEFSYNEVMEATKVSDEEPEEELIQDTSFDDPVATEDDSEGEGQDE